MLAKRVSRQSGKDSFKRLGLYIMSDREKKQAGLLPAAAGATAIAGGFRRTADYLLDLRGAGSRVGEVRITNCEAAEIADAIAEIQAVQGLNVRAKGDKTYHLVVSFPPGEHPTPDQLRDIEDELCAAVGLADHQRISAVHTDTDHLHIHVAISKIHPDTRRFIEPYYDKHKLMAACERLEVKHGLQPTNHGETKGNQMRGRGADMEAHSGQEALMSWIRANALNEIQAALRAGKSWKELHITLATFDLDIKPRGAGLVLATADGALMVRASRFSRALAMQALQKRWGPYAPFTGQRPPVRMRYEREPKRRTPSSARLWEEYQNQRQATKAALAAAWEAFREEHHHLWSSLQRWKDDRTRNVHNATELTAEGRAHYWSKYRLDVAIEERKFAESQAERRAAIQRNHPTPNWFAFLQAKANEGNTEALEILREREGRQRVAAEAFAASADEAQAKTVVFSALRPFTRKNGQVVYDLRDGGRVVDSSAGMVVEMITPHALFLTLSLQVERSPNGFVALGGDEVFQRSMVEMAAAKKMSLTFADPALERRRCELMGLPAPAPVATAQAGLLTRLGQLLPGGALKGRRA